MKKLNFSTILLSSLLLTSLSVQGMDQLALKAEEYNDTVCLLTSLPKETLTEIFSHCLVEVIDQVQSLKKSIKSFMQISTTCKKINTLLTFETIGNLCKNYAQYEKKELLSHLIDDDYIPVRQPALILLCAGVDLRCSWVMSLIQKATLHNDALLVTTFFKNVIDTSSSIDPCDKPYLLHQLAASPDYFTKDEKSCFNLLLNAMPHMINALNKKGQTPLDVAQEYGRHIPLEFMLYYCELYGTLIASFKEHGGLTAQELAQHGQLIQEKNQ